MDVNATQGTGLPIFRKFQESETLKGMRIFSFACVFIIGFLGNLLTIIAARRPRLQTVTNFFIANLSVADFTVSVVNVPLNIGHASLGYWPYGFIMCKVAPYLQGITVCASVGMLLAIATDRFLVIVFPTKLKLTTRKASAAVAVIWILSFIVPFPVLVFSQMVTANVGGRTYAGCFEIWPTRSSQIAYQLILLMALFLCPLLTMCAMYAAIEKTLGSAEWQQKVTRRVHKRIVRMLILVALLFIVCWLPFHVLLLYQEIQAPPETDSLVSLNLFVQWLIYANSACNPIVYVILNRGFRLEFLAIVRRITRFL